MTITADLIFTVVFAFNAAIAIALAGFNTGKSLLLSMVWLVVATIWLTLLVQR